MEIMVCKQVITTLRFVQAHVTQSALNSHPVFFHGGSE